MGSGGWKRGVLDRNMERFVRIKGFLHVKRRLLRTVKSRSNERCFGCENERFLRAVCKLSVNGKILVCEKGRFSAHAKQPDKEKTFFQRTTTPISHCNKTNVQLQISSAITYCELTVHLLIFEKTSVLRLLYSLPFAPIQSLFAGVLQAKPVSARAAGSFCKITSDRALNRSPESRGSQTSGVLLVLFVQAKSTKNVPLQGVSRFCKPRLSTPKQQLCTTQLNPFETFRLHEKFAPAGAAHFVCFLTTFRKNEKRHKKTTCENLTGRFA